jgi:hypothetical protein
MEPAPSTLASRLVARPDPLGPAAGWLLLLWPTLSALWIAAGGFPGWHLLVVFVVGTFLMRSALRRQKSPPNSFAHHPHEDSQGYRIEIPEAVY